MLDYRKYKLDLILKMDNSKETPILDYVLKLSGYLKCYYKNSIKRKKQKKITNFENTINGFNINSDLTLSPNPKTTMTFGEMRKIRLENSEIKKLTNDLDKLYEQPRSNEFTEQAEQLKKHDNTPKWFFPTSITTDYDLQNILEKIFTDDNDFIEYMNNNERIQKTLDSWRKDDNTCIKQRIMILEQGIKAHLEKLYYCSVSTLTPQVEGLLRDALEAQNRDSQFNSLKQDEIEKAVNSLIESWKQQFNGEVIENYICLLEHLPKGISDLYKPYPPEPPSESKEIYRHGICHGIQTNFGTESNSLRLILILDRIIFFLGQ
jgi:hypothetical protein